MKSTSSRLRLLLLIGPLLCPHFPLPTPPWSSPSTGPTTLPRYQIPSSRRCRATTSPCSCGCAGVEATSSRQPLRPEAVARRRRPSCAAPSGTVPSMIPKLQKKKRNSVLASPPQNCSGKEKCVHSLDNCYQGALEAHLNPSASSEQPSEQQTGGERLKSRQA